MKKYLLLFAILLLYKNSLGAPSNTLSITPVAVDATTITASDENTRNNTVVSTYNAHSHTDISQVANTFNIGDELAGNKTITAYNADTNKPFIRYDDTNNYWIASTNGIAPSVVLQGTGITIEGATDDGFETILSITDPTVDRTITIPNNTGTIILSGASVAQTLTFSGDTISNLGTVTTVDINGGTIDGVTIGGSSAVTLTAATGVTTFTASGNLDIGTYELRANTFESDVATGTAPLTVASATKVTNLNADLLDGIDSSAFIGKELFTSSGTFTSAAGVTSVYVTLCGGGGGGGGGYGAGGTGGSGGGSSAYAIKTRIAVTASTGYTVTVGAAGTGGVDGSDGTSGGNSSFAGDSVTVTVNGGGAGLSSGGATGGAAGAASTTTAVIDFVGRAGSARSGANGGAGAGGFSGTGGAGGLIGGTGGNAVGYGASGGGGYSGTTGGNGVAGFVLVEW